MKSLIIYVSYHHNNTEKIAKVIAKVLGADSIKLEQIDTKIILQYDLIGFGSGIYFFKNHKSIIKLAKELPNVNKKKAFVFSTSGANRLSILRRHKPLKKILQSKGFEIIGEFNCAGLDTYGLSKIIGGLNKGRPNSEDLNNAEAFATNLKEKITL